MRAKQFKYIKDIREEEIYISNVNTCYSEIIIFILPRINI